MEDTENKNKYNVVDLEKYILKLLLTDEDARDKLASFISPAYFDDSKPMMDVVKIFQSHREKYNSFPSPSEMLQEADNSETFDMIKEILSVDDSQFNKDFLDDIAAEFFRSKMISTHIFDMVEKLKKENDTSKLNDFPDKIREALSFSFDVRVGMDIRNDMERFYDFLHLQDKVVKTGVDELDKRIKGGIHEKTLTLFVAGTNVGKSAIKCALATNALLQNKKVLYITLEMSEEKIMERIVSNLIDVSINDLWKLTKTELGKSMYESLKNVSGSLIIKEFPTKGANANNIRSLLKELKIKRNFVPDIIFIDYLGIMNPCSRMEGGNTNSVLQRISEEVRGLAVEFGVPIVSSSQTNREGMKSSDFDLTDVADSIGQTMTADTIIGVQQTEEMLNSNLFSFKIMKNRYGGRLSRISVGIDYEHMRLINIKQDDDNSDVSDDMISSASEDMNRLNVQEKLNRKNKVIQFD